jgi:hypothetical protein
MRNELEGELAKNEQEFAKQQAALKQKERELAAQQESIDEQVAEKVKAGQKLIAETERKKIIAEQSEQTKALQEELAEKSQKLSEANKKELDLRRQQQKLEEEKANIELTVQRQLDEERKKISEAASEKAAEQQQLKMREKDDLIRAMQEQIENLKRRAEAGSQEAQGEALEGALQDMLQQTFPFDRIEEVKKGQRGADILQIVRNNTGKECGKILWESKNTKDFSSKWIEKIKADQQEASADMAVIMSIALPKGINNFGPYEGIWVTDYKSIIGLCTAFRETLIRVERERIVTQHQDGMKDVLYKYVTGQEFAMQIRAVAEAFIRMQGDLNKERRAMERIWKSREKQIETVLGNISGIRGSLEGYISQKFLPSIETLSLEAIEPDENEAEA